MPTVRRKDGYRFFFFSDEHEPKHIHVERAEIYARVDLERMVITESVRCSGKERRKILRICEEYRNEMLEAWNEFFNAENFD